MTIHVSKYFKWLEKKFPYIFHVRKYYVGYPNKRLPNIEFLCRECKLCKLKQYRVRGEHEYHWRCFQ